MRTQIVINHSSQGLIDLKCDYTNIVVNRKKEAPIYDERVSLDGEIKVFGDMYDVIISHNNHLLPFYYYEDGLLLCSGTIDLFYKREIYPRLALFKLTATDKYTEFDKHASDKFNICQVARTGEGIRVQDNLEVVFAVIPGFMAARGSYLTSFEDWLAQEYNFPEVTATRPSPAWGYFSLYNRFSVMPINAFWEITWATVKGYG